MPRRPRLDPPGSWFHVTNRAIARRSMFESRADCERFLDRLGAASAQGWLEVHAFTLLTTHFHLLVRSPVGRLSHALHAVQLDYSRYFNRGRRRDGPLVRGRFVALRVDSDAYRRTLVAYIDANAPRAGLAARPEAHAFGSCQAYVRGGGPPWLQRGWIEAEVRDSLALPEYRAARYFDVFAPEVGRGAAELVERRGGRAPGADDPTDSLLAGAAPAVLEWLRHKARLADGTRPGLPVASADAVAQAIAGLGRLPEPPRAAGRGRKDFAWPQALHAALLRDVAGLTCVEIAARLSCSPEWARTMVAAVRRAALADDTFGAAVAAAGHAAIVATHGRRGPPRVRADGMVVE